MQVSKRVYVSLLALLLTLSYFVSIVPKAEAQVTALSNDTPSLNYILTYKDFSFTAYGNYYTVVASRSTDSWTESPTDYDISVYNDVDMTQFVNESSTFPTVDAVVINREGLSSATMYAEVTWYSGSGLYAIVEAEYNTSTLPRNSTISEYFGTNEIIDEWDHYVYGGRTYEIELTEVPSGANYNIYLFTQNGSIGNGYTGEVGYAAKGNQSTPIIYTAPTTKWVCVLVTNENNVTGPYKITSRDIELQNDAPRNGALSFENNNDRYKFIANASEYTAVAMLPLTPTYDYDLKVYSNLNLTGLVLSSTMVAGYPDICVFDRIGLGSVTYYASAERWTGTGNYTIEKDGKRNIAVGTAYYETMNTSELIDTFQLQLNAGTQYKISIPTAPSGANYEIYLFNATSRIYQSVQSSGFVAKGSISTPITYTPQTTKQHLIVVTNLNAIYGLYSILVEIIPTEPIQTLSNNAPLTGTFDDTNTYDIFQFTVNPQSYTTIALRPPPSQDFDLEIYSDAALTNYITSSSRGSGLIDACIFNGYTISSSVTYYAKAYRYGSSSGQYTIEADSRDSLIMGNYTSRTMGTNNVVETFWINLTSGEEYIINFPPPNAAPEGAEYWFYAFSGNSTISAALASSHYTSGMYFKASTTGAHAFVILNLFNATGQAPGGDYKFRVRQIYRLYDDIPQTYSLNSVTHTYDEFNFTVWKNMYSVVAIKPTSTSSNYNLKVYSSLWMSDSSLVGESALSSNLVDAYVFNGFAESSTRPYYALATRQEGTGNYIVESDSEWNLSVGTTYDSYMGPGTIVDIYWCYLTVGLEYVVSLPTIPSGATFKLYAFADSGPISSAIVPTTSTSNSITFTPTVTKHYGILVISESVTSGSFQIRVALNNAPDFSISASPTTQAVYAGSSTQYTISLTSHNGFSSPVTLSIPWLPVGCSYSFSPSSPITPTASTTLTITTSSSTPVGTYNNITVRAVSGTLEHSVILTLTVNTPPVNPDIKPWSVWFYPTSLAIATIQTTINVSVANIGGQAITSSFTVALLIGGNTVQTWTVPSLGIGQRANLTTTYTFPSPGAQNIEVRCDTTGTITESNETNNNQIYTANVAEIALSGSTYTGSMNTAGQTYYYAIQYSAGATHVFNLTGSAGTDFDIHLYSQSGSWVDSSASYSYPEVIEYTSSSAGWYFLKVVLYSLPSGTYTLTIDGSVGPTPDFSISVNPSSSSVVAGNSVSYSISVTTIAGFSNPISFSTLTLPFDGSASFSPSTLNSPYTGGSTLTLSTTSSAVPGTYTATIVATSGSITHQTNVQLQINPPLTPTFTLSVTPNSQTVVAGNSVSYTLTLTSQNGFNSLVSLSVTTWPSGISGSFTPSQLTVSSTHTATLTVNTQTTATPGTYTITVNANGGSVSQSANVQLVVNPSAISDFALTPVGDTQKTITAGNSASFQIQATSIGTFSDTITFSYSCTPSGLTGSFSPSSVTLTAGGTATTTLTFTTTSSTPEGMYDIVVSGTSGAITKDMPTHLKLTVQAPPQPPYFSLMLDPSSATVIQGSDATISIAVNSHFGFTGSVTLSFVDSPTIITENAVFAPSVASPGNPSTLTIDTSEIPAGTYDFVVKGTSGSLTNITEGKLVVLNPPDFGIAATPSSFTIDARSSIVYNVTVGPLNGFSGAVSLSTPSLPGGIEATFQPQVVIVAGGPAVSKLTINTSGCPNADTTYQIKIRGTSGAISHECTISLSLRAVNKPPTITSFQPSTIMVSVNEGSSQDFSITATDDGGSPTIMWYVNGLGVQNGNIYTFSPDYSAAEQSNGVYKVCAKVSDGTNYVWQNWTVSVQNVNRAPYSNITMPSNGDTFLSGMPVSFDGTQSSDPDGDPIVYEWRDGEIPISAEGLFETSLTPGMHTITLVVSDGLLSTSSSVNVFVKYYSVNVSALNPSKMKATVGDKISIKAYLNNSGDADSPDLLIRFLVDSKIVDNRTGIKVAKGSSTTLDFVWTAVKGTHIIKVEIDDGNNANDKMIPIPVKAKPSTSTPAFEGMLTILAFAFICTFFVFLRKPFFK